MNISIVLVFGFTLKPVFNKHFLRALKPNCNKTISTDSIWHAPTDVLCVFTARHSRVMCLKQDGTVVPERSGTLTPAVDGFPRKQATSSLEDDVKFQFSLPSRPRRETSDHIQAVIKWPPTPRCRKTQNVHAGRKQIKVSFYSSEICILRDCWIHVEMSVCSILHSTHRTQWRCN